MKRWLPIRKIAVAGVGAGLTWAALRLGLDLGSDAANQAAVALVAGAFGYAEKDKRVVGILDEIEGVVTGTHQDVTYGVHEGPCGPECRKP